MTLAGLGTPEKPHPVQTAFIQEEVFQCGYCLNGWVMTTAALLKDKKNPTDSEIREGLSGLKCRCGTHMSHPARRQARRDDDGLREHAMTKMEKMQFTRRAVVQGAGMFVFSIGVPVGLDTMLNINAALAQGAKPALVPTELDSFLAINADGSVNVYFGKIDGGQGIDVAIARSSPKSSTFRSKSVKVIMGDTALTLNQGGASGSNGVQRGGMQMRHAAAEARRVLARRRRAEARRDRRKLR